MLETSLRLRNAFKENIAKVANYYNESEEDWRKYAFKKRKKWRGL